MRRLIMWNMITLDGFFEGRKPWDIGWPELGWGEELERLSIEQTSAADMLLFGRATYEGMAAYWPSAKGQTADTRAGDRGAIAKRDQENSHPLDLSDDGLMADLADRVGDAAEILVLTDRAQKNREGVKEPASPA